MFGVNLDFMTGALFPGKTEHQILTVGGRMMMWKFFLSKILESPVFGHGFAVLSSARGSLFASHPHSSVLSVLLGTGAFGALAFTIYVLRLFRELLRTNLARLPGAVGCASAMAAGLVNSLAMPLVGDQWEESSLVFASLTALFILYVYSAYLPEVNKLKRARAIVW
jgi:O-antigen ligase